MSTSRVGSPVVGGGCIDGLEEQPLSIPELRGGQLNQSL